MRIAFRKLLLFITVLGLSLRLAAVDNAHYYKAANLHRTPTTGWFDGDMKYDNLDWMSKIDFTYGYGDAGSAWNNSGNTTSLLNTTGNHNMLYLMENVVVNPNEQHFADFFANAQTNHWATNNDFAQLDFDGKFEIHDFNINIRQNLSRNFFAELLIPIRDVSIKNISYKDLSPDTGRFSKQTGEWKQFLNQFNTLLGLYGYKPYDTKYSKTDLGDISFNLGWQGIKEYKTGSVDFISFLAKLGVLFPTGADRDVDYVFSVPTGYDGQWGFNFGAQLEFCIKKVFTMSMHGGATMFFDESNEWRRLKTFELQNGFIKLEKGLVEEDKGTLWHLGADLKLDHVVKGFSLLVGYSFNRQENDKLTPNDSTKFTKSIVNSDSALDSWEMHVLHLMADYDFSVHMKKDYKYAPRISFFYNWPFDGKNAFKTDMIGGGLGLDIRWQI